MAKVTILLPSLNQRKFLDERVDSLLKQTFADWEAIVLDSGSTDGSWEFFGSIAQRDSRFHLHQIPREGLYAALNRGLELADGEFIHIATADDSMAPEFLAEMLNAFARCPQAGIAACDVLLIDRDGNPLTEQIPDLSKRSARNLLSLDVVRTAFDEERPHETNFRPIPHDCLLHFDGRSVYLSLNQLVVRTDLARAAAPFDTTIGSVGDFKWLLRLTSSTGTIHIPKKLAMWRYHGDQLSMQPDPSRASSRRSAAESTLQDISKRNLIALTSNDRAALLLPFQAEESRSIPGRFLVWLKSLFRLKLMFLQRPIATLRALRRVGFRFGTRRRTLVPMVFEASRLAPKTVEQELRS